MFDWIPISELAGAFAGGFFGALFALLAGIMQERRSEKRKTTQEFINEYFSADFLSHRVGVSKLRRKVLDQAVAVDAIAAGYWYPGRSDAYSGDMFGDFNEHQHLEAYFGYLVRLAHVCGRNLVDTNSIRAALRTSYFWHGDVANAIAEEVRRQVDGHGEGAELPIWVEALETVNELLDYTPKTVDFSRATEHEAQRNGI